MNKLIKFVKKPSVQAALWTLVSIVVYFVLDKGVDILSYILSKQSLKIIGILVVIFMWYLFVYINIKENKND